MLRGEVSHLIHPMQATFTLKEYTFHTIYIRHTNYGLRLGAAEIARAGPGPTPAPAAGVRSTRGGGALCPLKLANRANRPRARDTLHLPLWMASE